jgi:hypothetical protein
MPFDESLVGFEQLRLKSEGSTAGLPMLVYEMEAYPHLPRSTRRTDDVSLKPNLKLRGQPEEFLEQDFSVSPESGERSRDSRRNASCRWRLRLDISEACDIAYPGRYLESMTA